MKNLTWAVFGVTPFLLNPELESCTPQDIADCYTKGAIGFTADPNPYMYKEFIKRIRSTVFNDLTCYRDDFRNLYFLKTERNKLILAQDGINLRDRLLEEFKGIGVVKGLQNLINNDSSGKRKYIWLKGRCLDKIPFQTTSVIKSVDSSIADIESLAKLTSEKVDSMKTTGATRTELADSYSKLFGKIELVQTPDYKRNLEALGDLASEYKMPEVADIIKSFAKMITSTPIVSAPVNISKPELEELIKSRYGLASVGAILVDGVQL